jgi:hypothetical protein
MDNFLPGSFLVRKEALVIIDFETVVTVVVAGDKATLIPIGPSPGWPARQMYKYYYDVKQRIYRMS